MRYYTIFAADIIFDEYVDPVIIELNAFPGIEGPTQFGVDIYEAEIMKLNTIIP